MIEMPTEDIESICNDQLEGFITIVILVNQYITISLEMANKIYQEWPGIDHNPSIDNAIFINYENNLTSTWMVF